MPGSPIPGSAIPFVLAIDVEHDGRPARPGSGLPLVGLARTDDMLRSLRPRFEDATGRAVRFAWFVRMDPQIAVLAGRADALVEAGRPRIDEWAAHGDRIGLHTHAGRWDVRRGRWVVDHGSADWIAHCVGTSAAAFAGAFGTPCREHRFGDRWSSQAAFGELARLGVEVDLTIEPGQRSVPRLDLTSDATGRIPSYQRLRSEPFRNRASGLWLLPLSAADPAPALSPPVRLARRLRYAGRPRHRPLQLDRPWPSPGAFWDLVERTLDAQARPYFACAIRSDTIVHLGGRLEQILNALVPRALARRFVFTDGHGALETLGLLAAAPAPAPPPAPTLRSAR
jgi:hypothetical protein